jgi:lysophospholipase
MRLPIIVCLLVGCQVRTPLAKQPPIDLSAIATPSPTEFAREADLIANWNGPLRTFWQTGEEGTFAGVNAVPIHYVIHSPLNAKASVVILPGRTEAAIKYAEVAADLFAQGYATFVMDLRGQGRSGRMLPDRERGYVDAFADYVDDVHRFVTDVVAPRGLGRVMILAHSLGGAVAVLYVDRHPETIAALAMTAPMLDFKTGGFPTAIASTLAFTACSGANGTDYTLGAGPWERETDFSANTVSHSEARWQWKIDQQDEDPEIRLGGTTYRWVCQALITSDHTQAAAPFNPLPTLVLQAGDDSIVNLGGQDRYCEAAPRCQLSRFDGAFHEILQETDDIRNNAMAQVVKFFDHVVAQ